MPAFTKDFNALLDARFPILVCETHEEPRLLARITPICTTRDIPLFIWSHADGLKRSTETGAIYNTNEFTDALKHVDATKWAVCVFGCPSFFQQSAECAFDT